MTHCIYVGNLPRSWGEAELTELLASRGSEPVRVRLAVHTGSGRSRGFAFAELQSADAGAELLQALAGTQLEGRDLKVGPAHRDIDEDYRRQSGPRREPRLRR